MSYDEPDQLDMKVLGFLTTDRLDGDWNSLLFEIRNQDEEICETCNRHYDECETCECPNDAKCLVLCNREKEEEDEDEDPNYSDKICAERKANGTHNYNNGNIGCWCLDFVDVKECGHRFECGCGKPTCMEMDGEECDDIGLCSNEGCKHYYDSRNDNCDCNDKDCPYC